MHVRTNRIRGLQTLIEQGEAAKELSLWRLRLERGERECLNFDAQEAVLVLLEGHVAFSWNGQQRQARRDIPFRERASALYLPPGAEVEVAASAASEVMIVATPCEEAGQIAFVGPGEVSVNARGKGDYTREVHDIFVNDPHAKRLLVGETFNPPGMWSSFPPHKHDGEDNEPYLEEVYYYRLHPPQGFGYQGLYSKDGSLGEGYTVKDGDAVLIPRGFHPVAAAPGYQLYYLWALAGEQRKLALFEDPDHVWLHDA
jgi:5-deoxy-glucuronate isomerase